MKSKIVINEFRYNEFNDMLRTAKTSSHAKARNLDRSNLKNTERTKWTGTKSLSDAFQLTVTGYDAGIDKLPLNTNVTSGAGTECKYDICGGSIDIGEYMNNEPNCFITFEQKDSFALPRLTIYVLLSVAAMVHEKTILNATTSLIKIINKLQQDYDVRVIGIFNLDIKEVTIFDKIILKDFAETLVLNNLAASFHPSYFRRIYFRRMETNGEKFDGGYGRPQGRNETIKVLEKNDNDNTYRDATVYTPFLNDLQLENTKGNYKLSDCKTERMKQFAER